MYKREDKEFILDMFLACKNIINYIEGFEFESFVDDRKTIDAVVRNIEILGEAVKNISSIFKNKYPDINWKTIARTRDKFIHFYFGLDVDIIWQISSKDIPELYSKLKNIIKKEKWENELLF